MAEYIDNLRDDIAIAAMKAEIQARQPLGPMSTTIAEKAYKMADAMLRAREANRNRNKNND